MDNDWLMRYDTEGELIQAVRKSQISAVERDVVRPTDCLGVVGGMFIRFTNTDVKTVLTDILGHDITKMPSR
jgi:hypothetical protein